MLSRVLRAAVLVVVSLVDTQHGLRDHSARTKRPQTMPTRRNRSSSSLRHELTLVPATQSATSPSPSSFLGSISPVAAEPASAGPVHTTTSGRKILALQDRDARHRLFHRCDRNDRGSISVEELLDGIPEECPELNHPMALRRAFVAADVSRNGLVPRRDFRLMLEYAVFFCDVSDSLRELDKLARARQGLFSFDDFAHSVHELLPDNDYNEVQLRLHYDLIDKDQQGYIRFVDFCTWAAKEHTATKGGDSGPAGSPRVAYVWDGEPLSVAAGAKNWREAVRNHWMASIRLQSPEKLPQALRISRAQAAAEVKAERLHSAQAGADADDATGSAEEDQRATATETTAASKSDTSERETLDGRHNAYGDTGGFEMPNKELRRETFASMARNRIGELSVEDYTTGLDDLWPGLLGDHPASVERAFAAADTQCAGRLGTRDFRRLLDFTLYFYRYRTEFDKADQAGHGRVEESDFASICKRTGVRLSDAEAKREFASLDRHIPDQGHYQSGYIQFEQYCSWAAKYYVRTGRKLDEEQRMLERSKQRRHDRTRRDQTKSRLATDGKNSGKSEREKTPEHHRNGHGSHSKAWEHQKGLEGADAFYNLDRRPGQEWEERRHGAAFRRCDARNVS